MSNKKSFIEINNAIANEALDKFINTKIKNDKIGFNEALEFKKLFNEFMNSESFTIMAFTRVH